MMNYTEEEDVMFVCEVNSGGQLIMEDPLGFTDTIDHQITDVLWEFEEAETFRPQLHAENENFSREGLIIPTLHNVEVVRMNQNEVEVLGIRTQEDEEQIELNQGDDILSSSGNCIATQPQDVEQQPVTLSTTVERFPRTGKCGHECPECQKLFTTIANLRSHSLTHLDVETRKKIRDSWKFQCFVGFCKQKFQSNSKLQKHRLSHSDKKNFKCTECQKHFQTPQSMKEHRKVHKADCPNKCYFCNQHFSNKTDLNRHLKTHTGELDFKCEICLKEFILKQNLKSHVAFFHEKRRPHNCSACPKKFAKKQDLVKHFQSIH